MTPRSQQYTLRGLSNHSAINDLYDNIIFCHDQEVVHLNRQVTSRSSLVQIRLETQIRLTYINKLEARLNPALLLFTELLNASDMVTELISFGMYLC